MSNSNSKRQLYAELTDCATWTWTYSQSGIRDLAVLYRMFLIK